MKTTRFIYLLFSLFIYLSVFSQTDSQQILEHSVSVTSFDHRSRDLVGSSYITDSFLPATLSNSDDLYSIRYNVFEDQMEFGMNGKPYYLPKSFNYTINFTGLDKIYQVYTFEEKDKQKEGFFVVLNKGSQISLLLKETIKFFEEVKPRSGYEKYQPPTLKRVKDKLFIGFKNNTTSELPTKKKDIMNLFSSKSVEIENFAKANKLSFKSVEDLTKIFSYYNSLN